MKLWKTVATTLFAMSALSITTGCGATETETVQVEETPELMESSLEIVNVDEEVESQIEEESECVEEENPEPEETEVESEETTVDVKANPKYIYNEDFLQVIEPDQNINPEDHYGVLRIEKIYGKVLDSEGNGVVTNYSDPDHSYINYSCVENAHAGDEILTYLIYNPNSNYCDDVIDRFDRVIDCQHEE